MNIYELEKQTNVGLARSVFTLRTDAEARMRIHCRNHFLDAVRALIAEHDWRRGYAGPCPLDKKCPTCKLIRRLEDVE
jgi:hypothetical protein